MPSPIERLVAGLRSLLPGSNLDAVPTRHGHRIPLPLPAGADYRFAVDVLEHGVTIHAVLAGAPEGSFFWHLPYETWDPIDQDMIDDLLAIVRRLALSRTRITVKRGLLFWRFTCEALQVGRWVRVGGIICCLRLAWEGGSAGQVRFYSPPLA